MENNLQNNKLIAEFMGLKYVPEQAKPFFNEAHWRHYVGNSFESFLELEYNSSWDWLMPVVDKISEYRLAYPTEANEVCNLKVVINIDALYNACVKFIKWYNQQNN